jgi:hypothetical protein
MLETIKNLNLEGNPHKNLDWSKVYTEECNGNKIVRVSEYLQSLPENAIVDKTCGLGGTTYALNNYDKVVIVMPLRKLINQKFEKFPDVFKVEEGVTKNDIVTILPNKIITTYNSFYKLLDTINTSEYRLVVDEFHTIVSNYNAEIHKPLLEHFKGFKSYCFMSATVPFLLPIELKELPVVKLSKPTAEVNVKLVECTSPVLESINTIKSIFSNTKTLQSEKTLHYVFFVNSVSVIESILFNCDELNEENCNIFYGESNEKVLRLPNNNNFSNLKTINLITSCGFAGIDIIEPISEVYFISSPNKNYTLYNMMDINQALGRFRTSKMLNVTHFYRTFNVDITGVKEALEIKINTAKEIENSNLSEDALKWIMPGLPLYKGHFDEDAVISEKFNMFRKTMWSNNNCLYLNYISISKNVTYIKNVTIGTLKSGLTKEQMIELFGEEVVDEVGIKKLKKQMKEQELLNSKLLNAEKMNLLTGNYYPAKDVKIKDIKGFYNYKPLTHRINGIPTRCYLILGKTYSLN